MGHSPEQIISWATNQASTGTTGTRRLISHHDITPFKDQGAMKLEVDSKKKIGQTRSTWSL